MKCNKALCNTDAMVYWECIYEDADKQTTSIDGYRCDIHCPTESEMSQFEGVIQWRIRALGDYTWANKGETIDEYDPLRYGWGEEG